MEFALSEEQQEFKAECRRFAAEVIRPAAPRHDADESTPWEVIKEARNRGLHGIEHVQRLGADPDGQLSCIYAEELHWGCAGIALAISGSTLAAAGLASSGTPEQIAKWVPECFGMGDDVKLGAYAVTEPQAGSDVKSLRTTAKLDGDEWVLDGTKIFITNGGIADVHVIVATVDPELGHRGQASFVIGKGTPGLRQGKKESKLGIRASHTAEVVLEECRIPAENLLGGMEKLERKLERARTGQSSGRASGALATFELTRPVVGASALGIAQAAYEWTHSYLDNGASIDPIEAALDDSSSAGKPPLERQGVQQVLAQVATEIEAARLLVQRASWMGRTGIPLTGGQGSMSKLKAGDVAMWATRTLMDLVGPAAWSSEFPLEKWFRDAKIYQLFEGTAEIQRLVISRMQADEYRQRLAEGAEIAADAVKDAGANGDRVSPVGAAARAAETVASGNGAGIEDESKATA
jgi:alkylation response protein AidB-like acyl-CoA dehydrogenase